MFPKYPPGTTPLQIYIKTIHKILSMLNSNKPQTLPKTDSRQTGPKTVTMPSRIPIIGITKPENLAEGKCPCCHKKIDLWLSQEGIILTSRDKTQGNF